MKRKITDDDNILDSGDGYKYEDVDERILAGSSVLKKGPWTEEEDVVLRNYVEKNGEGNWNAVQRFSGLLRCGKSCRLRWVNHLKPGLKKGPFTLEEEQIVVKLHAKFGNKWSRIAVEVPGRSDNEIKNFWNTRAKKLQRAGLTLYPPGMRIENQNESQQSQQSTTFSNIRCSSSSNFMDIALTEIGEFKIQGKLPLANMSGVLSSIDPQGLVPFAGFRYAPSKTTQPQGLVATPSFSHTNPPITLNGCFQPMESYLTCDGLRDTTTSGIIDHNVLQQQPRPYELTTINELYSSTDNKSPCYIMDNHAVINSYNPSMSEPSFGSTIFEQPSIQMSDYSFFSTPCSPCPYLTPQTRPSQLQSTWDSVNLLENAANIDAYHEIDLEQKDTDYIFNNLDYGLETYDQDTSLMDPFDPNISMHLAAIPDYTTIEPPSAEVVVSEGRTSHLVHSQTDPNFNWNYMYEHDNSVLNEWFV